MRKFAHFHLQPVDIGRVNGFAVIPHAVVDRPPERLIYAPCFLPSGGCQNHETLVPNVHPPPFCPQGRGDMDFRRRLRHLFHPEAGNHAVPEIHLDRSIRRFIGLHPVDDYVFHEYP